MHAVQEKHSGTLLSSKLLQNLLPCNNYYTAHARLEVYNSTCRQCSHMEGFSSDGVEVLSRKIQCVSAPPEGSHVVLCFAFL